MIFAFEPALPLRAGLAGWFVSRGKGSHPTRMLDSWELIHVVRGTLHLFEDESTFLLGVGDALLLHPGRRHGAAAPYAADCSFHWIHFHADQSALVEGAPQRSRVSRPERLASLFRQYMNDQETGELTEGQASLMVRLMLEEASRPEPVPADASSSATLARLARQFVLQNLDSELSTSRIAAALDCHPDYLGRCFRETYRETITDAIQGERLRRAKAFLLEDRATIEAVSRQCGFQSTAFFRRVFRRTQGMSPTRFRAVHSHVRLNTE